jgi:ATP-binding cassette subfamily C protein
MSAGTPVSETSISSRGKQNVIRFASEITASRRRGLFQLSLARAGFRITFVLCLGIMTARMIEDGVFVAGLAVAAAASLLIYGLLSILADTGTAAAEKTTAEALLGRANAALAAIPAREAEARQRGKTIAQLQRYPGAVARFCVSHWLARMNMTLAPLLVAGGVAFVSWQAAVALIAATPVMILFFSLIGGLIQDKAEAQEKALGRLAAQFSDRVRTLPTILANHALAREDVKLARRMRNYAGRTLSTLSAAFLNSAVLDFFSALSIAILAVFLGLGHLGLAQLPGFHDLALWQSLTILLLAPEYFAPLRRYAEQYHLKAEGKAAAEALDWILEIPEDGERKAAGDAGSAHHPGARKLVLQFAGPVADFTLPVRGLVVLTGPSGSGKTMLLKTFAGVEAPVSGSCGLPHGAGAPVSWVSADTFIAGGTLEDAIGRGRNATPAATLSVADALGLIDERYLPGGLAAHVAEGGENLSGGQRMRIALARGLLDHGPLLCDEPTAKMDPHTAGHIRDQLVKAAGTRLVIAATHDPALIEMAGMQIRMNGTPQPREMVA